jgi:hypothetical protein
MLALSKDYQEYESIGESKMVKRVKVPSGCYTASEARERLNMLKGTFFYHVRTGKINKVESPYGGKEGFYDKKEIDKMAQDMALFTLIHSIEPITFNRVQSSEDIRGVVDLCISIYGQGGTPTYDARLEIWQKNPYVYYIVKQEGIVVGYISLIWFDDEAIKTLMGPTPKQSRVSSAGAGVYSVTGPEHILPFTPGEPIDSLFISLGVRPGLSNTEQREYAFKLLRGTQDVLADFARQGMAVRKLYATSERGDGITMARKFGMKETVYLGDHIRRYEIDIETSDHPLFLPYKAALIEWNQQSA